MPAHALLAAGTTFAERYEVVGCLSSGGMGAVYEVVHLETRRRRALKVMLPSIVHDEELRARFRLEATVTADIRSDHIVEIFDAGVDEDTGAPFLVMELLKGEDLATISKRGPMACDAVVLMLHQVALALDKTHAAGIVHRDLKPENLFLTRRDDGSPCVKVLDFGIAKLVARSTSAARATRTVGTPLYMSPEQVEGDGFIGPAADIYALGQIAYTLLAGRAYWEPDLAKCGVYPLLVRIGRGIPEPASVRAGADAVLPDGFDAWFEKAVATSPHHRFGGAIEAVTALGALARVAAPATAAARTPAEPSLDAAADEAAATAESATSTRDARPSDAWKETVPLGPVRADDTDDVGRVGESVPRRAPALVTAALVSAAAIAFGAARAARAPAPPAPGPSAATVLPVGAAAPTTVAAPSPTAPVDPVVTVASAAPSASTSASPAAPAARPRPRSALSATATATATPPPPAAPPSPPRPPDRDDPTLVR